MDILAPTCHENPGHPHPLSFAFKLCIVLGILVSYIPQHARIISRRSSEGLSPYFVLLGATSSTFSIFNVVTIPESLHNIDCCGHLSGYDCIGGLLGIAQIAVQWGCFSVILILFLIFFPTPGPESHPSDAPARPTYKTALTVVFICIAHFATILVLSSVFLLFYPQHLLHWATALGICAALLACVQYIPQLWTTWKLQHVMSLSIPMMCIQTPGSFVFAASLFAQYGWAGWSVWSVYCITGLLQGGLLVMGIKFELRDLKARKAAYDTASAEADEHTALLDGDGARTEGSTNGRTST